MNSTVIWKAKVVGKWTAGGFSCLSLLTPAHNAVFSTEMYWVPEGRYLAGRTYGLFMSACVLTWEAVEHSQDSMTYCWHAGSRVREWNPLDPWSTPYISMIILTDKKKGLSTGTAFSAICQDAVNYSMTSETTSLPEFLRTIHFTQSAQLLSWPVWISRESGKHQFTL